MNKINWNTYKFHPHMLPKIMTASKSKTDILSTTAKGQLDELWIKEVFGRENFDTKNKYTQKGIISELDSLKLINQVTGKVLFKNEKTFENRFLAGTPDIIVGRLIDIKSSWSIFSFNGVEEQHAYNTYYYQLLGYMWLLNRRVASVIFCLVNTPEEIMNDELYRLSFKFPGMNDLSEAEMNRFKCNFIFDDIDPKSRMKKFIFKYDHEKIVLLKERLIAARIYLKNRKL